MAEAQVELTLLRASFTPEDAQTLDPILEPVYAFYADRGNRVPRLRYWYCLRYCCDQLLRFKYADAVDVVEGDEQQRRQQVITSLRGLIASADAEIQTLEKQARANRPPAIGRICRTAPETHRTPPTLWPDPNDSRYRGDPLKDTLITPI